MKKLTIVVAVSLYSSTLLTGCGASSSNTATPVLSPDPTTTPTPVPTSSLSAATLALGITDVPSNIASTYTAALKFNRYASVATPNGKKIGLIAQDGLSDNQIVRAREILKFYLTNVAHSKYGVDKTAVANKIADSGAKILLLNGVDDGKNPAANLDGQPLYYGEIQVEGGQWYTQQNYEHRDASYEEILHFVHDNGIGVDQNSTFTGVLPKYQAEIRAAQIDASAKKLWGAGQDSWIKELTTENSLTQEYLAAAIDAYYGLWGAWTPETTAQQGNGMWGFYVGKTRPDTLVDDPAGYAIIEQFFSPVITYNARIDEAFTGTFSLTYDALLPYTHHSQYLKDITFTGAKSNSVRVNKFDNNVTGNAGSNTAIFTGVLSEYSITVKDKIVTVKDLQDSRDGENMLTNFEKIQFSNSTIDTPTS